MAGEMDELIRKAKSHAADDGYRRGLQKGKDNCAANIRQVLEALEEQSVQTSIGEFQHGFERGSRAAIDIIRKVTGVE